MLTLSLLLVVMFLTRWKAKVIDFWILVTTGVFGHGFDPHVWQHSLVEIGHEIISTAILSLPQIQET